MTESHCMKCPNLSFVIVCVMLATGLQSARCEDLPPTGHKIAITMDALYLRYPALLLTGEFRVAKDMGMGGSVGYGSMDTYPFLEVGAQYAYDLIGSFDHGMQFGGMLRYLYMWDSKSSTTSTSGTAVKLGALLGYKLAADFGLTVNPIVSVGYGMISASATDGFSHASLSADGLFFDVNFNVGWSF